MTVAEANKSISEAEDINWFKNLTHSFKYPSIDVEVELEGLSAIYSYVHKQAKGWSDIEEALPSELQQSKNYFESLKGSIASFISSYNKQAAGNLNYHWRTIKSKIDSSVNGVLPYESPETEFLIKVYSEDSNLFSGAYHFIIGSVSLNSKHNFSGALLAYEFTQKSASEITKRRASEKASISRLRNDFESSLSEMNNQLVTHLRESADKYDEYTKSLDGFKENKEKLISDWFINTKGEFEAFSTESNSKIQELENTYEQLLRLKKPAEYWKQRAKTLKTEGWIATGGIFLLVLIACTTLYALLWKTPEGMLASFFKGESSAIRWSIIYVTFISFLAFGIRILNKVAFSSFHLSRDAEEREQLTYVYLALIKEAGIEDRDRHLIMQSLFSRADTGLLKEDSSPTMPSDFTGKLMSK